MTTHPPNEALVTFCGVSVRDRDTTIFENTNWQILRGQRWAVLGPNGSGKSKLIHALAGQLPTARGKIVYGSTDRRAQVQVEVVSFQEHRTMVKRHSDFYQARWHSFADGTARTVADYCSHDSVFRTNPFQVPDLPPRPPDPHFGQEVGALLGITDLFGKQLNHLSNGQMRKVLIARALLKKPQILVLSHPFLGLDSSFRARLDEILEHLPSRGTNVVLVESRADRIPSWITHVARVQDSQIITQGPRDRVLGPTFRPSQRIVCDSALRPGASDNRALVRFEDVNVRYGDSTVLDRVTWTLHQGQHWVVFGPNGAGKTTLLSLISGDNPQAYSNQITLFGRRRGTGESIWEIKRRLGSVSPELHLHYPRNARCIDVVKSGFFDSVGLYRRASAEQAAAASEWMLRLGIERLTESEFGRVSAGEQRLVLLARAIVKEPELLLLDEPCQGLDPANRTKVLETIAWISNHLNTSTIYVTHDIDELPTTTTHVLELGQGNAREKTVVQLDCRESTAIRSHTAE